MNWKLMEEEIPWPNQFIVAKKLNSKEVCLILFKESMTCEFINEWMDYQDYINLKYGYLWTSI